MSGGLNLQSVRSHLMREDFQRFWEYCHPACAAKFLDEWCTRTMRSKIDPMKKVAKTLRRHRDLILNWFRAEGAISAGIVEGLNNKAKLTMRKAYGFRTAKAIEIALYHQLGDLPEPEFTHEFWRGGEFSNTQHKCVIDRCSQEFTDGWFWKPRRNRDFVRGFSEFLRIQLQDLCWRVASGRKGLHGLGHDEGLAVVASEPFVGLRVVREALLLGVERQLRPER